MFLLSRSETFGIAAIEAGTAGLPLVLSTAGGLAELVIDGVTGFSVRPNNRGDLIAALGRLADDADLRRRFGRAGRRRVEQEFDARPNADRLDNLALRCRR